MRSSGGVWIRDWGAPCPRSLGTGQPLFGWRTQGMTTIREITWCLLQGTDLCFVMLRPSKQVGAYFTVPSGLGNHPGKFKCGDRMDVRKFICCQLKELSAASCLFLVWWDERSYLTQGRMASCAKDSSYFSNLQLTKGRAQFLMGQDLRHALYTRKLYYLSTSRTMTSIPSIL